MKKLKAGGVRNRALLSRACRILGELKLIGSLWLYEIIVYLLYRYNLIICGCVLSLTGIYIIEVWFKLKCSIHSIIYHDECVLSRWLAIISIVIGRVMKGIYRLGPEFDIFILYNCLFVISSMQGRYKFKVWKKEEIQGYAKLSSLHDLMNKGLNVHNFLPCRNIEEIMSALQIFNGVCTVRTDRFGVGQGKELQFYVLTGGCKTNEYKIACEIVQNGLIAIVSDGLKYDDSMRYNAVYKLYESGEFEIEYSRYKVPLRNMYRYPERLNMVRGSLDSPILYWNKRLAIHELDRIDLREIKELLGEQYMVCLKNNTFGRYIEMTTYELKVGVRNEDKVYWEVR